MTSLLQTKLRMFLRIAALPAIVLSSATAVAGVERSSGDVFETWCLDSESAEIYTMRAEGVRELLVITEAVSTDEGEVIDNSDATRMFDEGLVEAIDGADALNTSFAADAWETVIELIYGHDAFGQRVEIVDKIVSDSGDNCRVLKSPGFATMFRAFWESSGRLSSVDG